MSGYYVYNYLSRFISNYDGQHWREVEKVFRYLKGTVDVGILYIEDQMRKCI